MIARWAWPGLCLLLGLGALTLQLGAGDGAVWALDRSKAWGEPWRLLSAALWHWNGWHLAGNLAGLALLALLGWRAGFGMRPALAWLLAWPLTQALLLLQPRRCGGSGWARRCWRDWSPSCCSSNPGGRCCDPMTGGAAPRCRWRTWPAPWPDCWRP